MLEKIPLPIESKCTSRPSFPVADAFADICLWRKSKNQVHMIRHDGGRMDPPNARVHAMQDRVSDSSSDFGRGERHQTPILHAASHKKHGSVNIHPERKIVGQGLAAGIHGTTLWKTRVGIKSKKRRAGWRPLARQRLSKILGRDGSPSRPTFAALPPLSSQRRRFAPESWGRSESRPYFGGRFALPRGWLGSGQSKNPSSDCRCPKKPAGCRAPHPCDANTRHPFWGKWFYLAS